MIFRKVKKIILNFNYGTKIVFVIVFWAVIIAFLSHFYSSNMNYFIKKGNFTEGAILFIIY
jgi:uncharacterized protein YggT (Ycf19 family)